MASGNPPLRPAYSPPQTLLSSCELSRDEFLSQYEAFCQSLRYAEAAPELVFERLVWNVHASQPPPPDGRVEERTNHATAQDAWRREKAALQSELDHAKAATKSPEKVSPVVLSVPGLPVPVSNNQMYLQFILSSLHVHAATTTVPVPYGLVGNWHEMDHIRSSTEYGTYDTRMDTRITSPTLPTTITHVVHFKKPFSTPPTVLVWLMGLSATSGAAVSVKATANNITETEFVLQISTGGGAPLGSVGAAWAVWSGVPEWGRQTVNVGSVSTAAPEGAELLSFWPRRMLPVTGSVQFVAACAVDLLLSGGVWVYLEIVYEGGNYRQDIAWKLGAAHGNAKVDSARLAYSWH